MAEQTPLEVREAVVIQPGDHLIVRVDPGTYLTQEDVQQVQRTLMDREPRLHKVTVVAAHGLYVVRDEASNV